jgi:integrase/recombinase XerC
MYAERFIDYIRYQKRFSPHTIIAYRKDIEQFLEFTELNYQTKDPRQINHLMIRSWIVDMIEGTVSTRSVNRKLSALKSFYKYLLKEGKIKTNPLLKINAPKSGKRLPEFIEQENMDILLDDEPMEKDFTHIRDRLIVEMFYFTGMRLSELINLTDQNISLMNSSIKVLGKRNKERIIPFGNELKKSIKKYLEVRKKEVTTSEQNSYFFVSKQGKKVYEKLVYRVVNSYLSKVSTKSKKSPHVLRHTFATHMLNNGADLNSVKELLGHSNLAATQVYTHNTVEKLKSIYKQAHPRA